MLRSLRWLPLLLAGLACARSQSADWNEGVCHEPQVRYLLAHLALGGEPQQYRGYATVERDPDSREAIRLWDAGTRVVNIDDFELKVLAHPAGKDGKILRVVLRGTERTIHGNEVFLTSDLGWSQGRMRAVLADLTLGAPLAVYLSQHSDPSVAEALRRWEAGARCINLQRFAASDANGQRRVVYRGTDLSIDGAHVELNSDAAYSEVNVRYFMADIALGGSLEFYRSTAIRAHETACAEAVARLADGYRVVNAGDFERKQLKGKTVITRKGSEKRISGSQVEISSDHP